MKNIKYIILSMIVLLGGLNTFAQVDLISAKDFKALLKNNKELIVIDASKSKKYAKAHIPNAIFINHNNLYKDGDVKGVIKPVDELAKFFGNLGINEKSEVVLYDGGKQKYSSRIYWILKYLGAENVKILHQDPAQWKKLRLTVTSKVPKKRKPVVFTPIINESIYASTEYVNATLDSTSVVLIDVRTPEEFEGGKAVTGDKKGHIPGSININYTALETETGAFKSKEALEAIAKKYNLTPDMELIFLCKTSVRGAVAYVAFKNVLGYEKVKLYDGACTEWCTKHPLIE